MKALVAAVLLGLLCQGCSSAPDRKYYGLAYSLSETPSYPSPRYPVTLRIQEPEVRLAYDRPQIVYRYDPYNFRYYHFRFWVAKPQSMVAELVLQHLKHLNLFREISLTYTAGIPDYELAGQIDALEEYDSGDTWYAHLAMSFRLVRFSDRQVVFTWQFDEKKEVFTKEPVYVVRGLSELLDQQMQAMMPALDKAMEAEMAAAEARKAQ